MVAFPSRMEMIQSKILLGIKRKSAIITLSARMTSCLLTHIAIMAIPV